MCCCWLGWWLPGRSRWTSYCVDEALWGPLCLRQKKVSWRRPAYSRPRSRSDTHPRHAKMHEWAQPDKSGKACMYTVLKISQAENGVCCLLVISCASKEHETLSFRIWTKKVNGPWTLLGSICCLWLPKESLWVLPSPWETLAPPPTFPSTIDVSTFSKVIFQTTYSTLLPAGCSTLPSGMLVNA